MARNRRPQPNALVAAAQRVRLADPEIANRQVCQPQEWHPEAWAAFDEVPEIKESVRYRGNQLAKLRLYCAVMDPNDPDGDPVPVSDESSGVPAAVAEAAVAELARLRSALGGQPEILRQLDMNLEIVGECYLVGIAARVEEIKRRDGSTLTVETDEDWRIHSKSEITFTSGPGGALVGRVKGTPDDREGTPLDPERDTIIRIWTRHPQWQNLPDSAMRGLLTDCKVLQVLQQQLLAQAMRAVSAGFLTVPNELSFGPLDPTVQPTAGDDAAEDPLDAALREVLVNPIADPSDPSTVQPGVFRGPSEYLKPDVLRLIRFYDPQVSADLEAKISARVERIARGLNLPVEKVMGHQQTTYANAAQVDEDEFEDYLAPSADLACDALSYAFLTPQLRENPAIPEEWANGEIFIWRDPSDLIAQPDTEANADAAFDRFAIGWPTYRKAKGYSEDDAPTEKEIQARLALPMPSRNGSTTAPTDAPPDPNAAITAALVPLLELIAGRHEGPPPFPYSTSGPNGAPRRGWIEASARPEPSNVGRDLMLLDRDLRTRLVVAANDAMGRALDLAGTRLRSRVAGTQYRNALRGIAARDGFAHLGRTVVTAAFEGDDPLAGAFTELESQFREWGGHAQNEAIDLASRVASGFGTEQRAALGLRQAEDLDEAWAWMDEALRSLAAARLYDPNPAAPDLGEFDPTLKVPTGLVRQALARAGGAQGLIAAGPQGEGGFGSWVTLTDGGTRPAGGIGTGELVRGALRDGGAMVEAYRWVYGPGFRTRPFHPHLALDGELFRNFDDPVLTNGRGWPPFSFYMPGDHAGCICDFEPVVVPASEFAAERGLPVEEPEPAPLADRYPGGLTEKGATQWMQDRWGTDDVGRRLVDFSGMGAPAANDMAASLDRLFTAYPQTAQRLRAVGASAPVTKAMKAAFPQYRIRNIGGNAYADTAEKVGWMRVSGGKAKKYEEITASLARDVETGWHPPHTGSIDGVVSHEFGHNVFWEAKRKGGSGFLKELQEIWDRYSAEDDALGLYQDRPRSFRPWMTIRERISRYGATNHDEMMAEAFAEYELGGDAADPMAREMSELAIRYAEGPEPATATGL